MRYLLLPIVLLLSGCGGGGGGNPPTNTQLPAAYTFTLAPSQWTIAYSPGMPVNPAAAANGWQFNFPVAPETEGAASVHYVTTVSSGIGNSTVLSMLYNITETGSPVYQGRLASNNTCDSPPPNVSLYFEQRGDDMTLSDPKYEFYRWWSVANVVLQAGEGHLSVPLNDPSLWLSVLGKKGDAAPMQFAQAKQNVASIGMTFGAYCFRGHGVNISQGSSVFDLTNFSLQ